MKHVFKKLFVCTFLPFFISCHYNVGHRLGGDVFPNLPENTIESLNSLLKAYSDHSRFKYLELDIQESIDSTIFVFHDENIERMVKINKFGNSAVIDDFKMRNDIKEKINNYKFCNFTAKEIEKFNLTQDSIKIPRLENVFNHIKNSGYEKKVYVEIKGLRTENTRNELFRLIKGYENNFNISILAFKNKFKNSFPKPKIWCDKFKNRGFKVLTIGWHNDLCSKMQ